MVRRLPRAFRKKLYYQYQAAFGIPGSAFDDIISTTSADDSADSFSKSFSSDEAGEGKGKGHFGKREGGEFERRIAGQGDLSTVVEKCVQGTVAWPATSQTVKSFFTAGVGRAWRYYRDKRMRSREKGKGSGEGEGSAKHAVSPPEDDEGEGQGKEKKG